MKLVAVVTGLFRDLRMADRLHRAATGHNPGVSSRGTRGGEYVVASRNCLESESCSCRRGRQISDIQIFGKVFSSYNGVPGRWEWPPPAISASGSSLGLCARVVSGARAAGIPSGKKLLGADCRLTGADDFPEFTVECAYLDDIEDISVFGENALTECTGIDSVDVRIQVKLSFPAHGTHAAAGSPPESPDSELPALVHRLR